MAKARPLPPLERVRELLDYDPETGVFRWRVTQGSRAPAGAKAGGGDGDGYLVIRLDGILYRANQLAHLLMTGADPGASFVDHRDIDRSNNRWSNLRLATRAQNLANTHPRRSLPKGVRKVGTRYHAQITTNRRATFLGTFGTAAEAGEAYRRAAFAVWGEFSHAG